jgi:hypothetical protein
MIQCKETGCTSSIGDPCHTVITLFNLKIAMDLDKNPKGSAAIDRQLMEIGLINHEEAFKSFKHLKARGVSSSTKRTFVLKCVKGHINEYELDCKAI